jgi:hypothetical protein
MTKAACAFAAGIAVCGCLYAPSGDASRPSLTECFEGSDFIGNAALSRDAGMPGDAFIERMEQDFALIHAFPSELRWFVHDVDDEAFLLTEARDVFERPAAPDGHRRAFLEACIERMQVDFSAPRPLEKDATPAASGAKARLESAR